TPMTQFRKVARRAFPAAILKCAATGMLLVAAGPSLQAWGPHSEITGAALQALPAHDALLRHLGSVADRLTNYCWMADYRRFIYEDGKEQFYADDYLLFPGMSRHVDHICPEVMQTYEPYFRRAVLA